MTIKYCCKKMARALLRKETLRFGCNSSDDEFYEDRYYIYDKKYNILDKCPDCKKPIVMGVECLK